MTLLIDTNIIIDHLRNDPNATDLLRKVETGAVKALISVITEYELLASKRISEMEQREIQKLLAIMPRRTVTPKIVQKAALFHRMYDTDIADALIAATALTSKAILITRNLKHFEPIREIRTRGL